MESGRLESVVFACNSLKKNCITDFSLDIYGNCLGLMLQTVDFLKFPEELLFETHECKRKGFLQSCTM